jgi:hypothetical protein
LGDTAGSRVILEQARARELEALKTATHGPAILYRLAALDSCLGKKEAALEHLRAAVGKGWLDYRTLRLDPRFDALAGDASFRQIIAGLSSKVAMLRRQTDQPTKWSQMAETPPP